MTLEVLFVKPAEQMSTIASPNTFRTDDYVCAT
jgi:hypothetical protein